MWVKRICFSPAPPITSPFLLVFHKIGRSRFKDDLAAYYDSRLGNVVDTPRRVAGSRSAWAQYSILLDNRDHVAAALKEKGVPTAIYYPLPMHLQSAYREFGDGIGSMPVSESLSKRILSLPMHPYMDEATRARICDELAAIL